MLLLANAHARMAKLLGTMGVKWNIGRVDAGRRMTYRDLTSTGKEEGTTKENGTGTTKIGKKEGQLGMVASKPAENALAFDNNTSDALDNNNNNNNTTTNSKSNNNSKRNNNRAFRDFSEASTDVFNLATEGGNNSLSYFVATQDDALADALRAMPYVPLFRLGRAVLLLESPSSASRSYTGSNEREKLASAGGLMTAEEREMVKAVNRKDRKKRKEVMREEQKRLEKRTREEFGGGFNVRRKKKAKGPNPLSCKSKK
mmetsp:Transcript_7328/g.15851  ORF Transcript_7328/g.15851 Transcript_7328/m.15851 type:complete len:258 (+) Transcript_7328:399-1172(+)